MQPGGYVLLVTMYSDPSQENLVGILLIASLGLLIAICWIPVRDWLRERFGRWRK